MCHWKRLPIDALRFPNNNVVPMPVNRIDATSGGSRVKNNVCADQQSLRPAISMPGASNFGRFQVFTAHLNDIDDKMIAAWRALERRALAANAYLSPNFVLPALKHLGSGTAPLLVFVERHFEGVSELAGMGVFEHCPANRQFPLPHLSAYASRHSYLSGLLVDRACAEAVVSAFFDFFVSPGARWHGIMFNRRLAAGPLAELLEQTGRERGVAWNESFRNHRAILVPAQAGEDYLAIHLPHSRQKDLRRRMRRLGEHGAVSWRARVGAEVTTDCIDRFIELEHMSWKGTAGTSLRSVPTEEAFFREMADSFRERDQLFFTELVVDREVVASTSNLVSGNAGFAFKLCWHPAFAKTAPGLLNEVELIRHAPTLFRDLQYLDSGSAEGSFMEELWAGRQWLTSGIFPTTSIGRQARRAMQQMRRVKQWLMVQSYLAWSFIEPIAMSGAAPLCV